MNKFSTIFRQAAKVFARFPVAMLFCVVLAIDVMTGTDEVTINTMLLPLGFWMAIALRIFTENAQWKGWRKYADVLAIPLIFIYYHYYISLPSTEIQFRVQTIIVFYVATLALLCIAPWFSTKKPAQFWHYNIRVWWQLLFSIFCAHIFFVAFLLAFYAIENLFDITHLFSASTRYLIAFFYCLFLPIMFATGVPTPMQITEQPKKYAGVRIIGQYILLPILAVYLVILYVYGGNILLAWELPKGWLSWMILIYSGVGIFAYLLLYNQYTERAAKASSLFGKYFFYTELPLFLLLFFAIYRRTIDYGITENRYYVWLALFWLLGVSLYMIFNKGKNLRPAFVSFAALALLSLFGWWSASGVSNRSQFNCLKTLMEKNELLHDGKLDTALQKEIASSDLEQMKNIIHYFKGKGNIAYVQPLFVENMDSLLHYDKWGLADQLLKKVSIATETKEFILAMNNIGRNSVDISGYKHFFTCHCSYFSDTALSSQESAQAYVAKQSDEKGTAIRLYHYGRPYKTINIVEAVKKIPNTEWGSEMRRYKVPQNEVCVIIDKNYKIFFKDITIVFDNNNEINRVINLDFYLLEK
jgi:hypothetical protein